MATCNGKCRNKLTGYGAATIEHGGNKSLYALGYKRCGCCECFFQTEAIHCECCGEKMRWRPRPQAAYRVEYKHRRPTFWTIERERTRI